MVSNFSLVPLSSPCLSSSVALNVLYPTYLWQASLHSASTVWPPYPFYSRRFYIYYKLYCTHL